MIDLVIYHSTIFIKHSMLAPNSVSLSSTFPLNFIALWKLELISNLPVTTPIRDITNVILSTNSTLLSWFR